MVLLKVLTASFFYDIISYIETMQVEALSSHLTTIGS